MDFGSVQEGRRDIRSRAEALAMQVLNAVPHKQCRQDAEALSISTKNQLPTRLAGHKFVAPHSSQQPI